MSAKQSPYGSWKSPITSDLIVSNMVRLGKVCLDSEDIFWLESRPEESGRDLVCGHIAELGLKDIVPEPFNCRTRVHEFGGGGFTASNGMVFFSNLTDQRIYMQSKNGNEFTPPRALTPTPQAPGRHLRFADLCLDHSRRRVIAVQEDHRNTDTDSPAALVAISLDGDSETLPLILIEGADFYTSPKVSPDGKKLAWLCWNHPNMPWYSNELWVADILPDGSLQNKTLIGTEPDEAIFQPEWSPDNLLYFSGDQSGWWNIYRIKQGQREQIMRAPVECGMAHIYFGNSTFAFRNADEIICCFAEKGMWQLGKLDIESKTLTKLACPYQEITFLKANEKQAVFRGGSPSCQVSIISIDLESGEFSTIKKSFDLPETISASLPNYISKPEAIEFPSESGRVAHAFYYPPRNDDYFSEAELPPLIIKIHGGPNNQAFNTLDLSTQYWTSRGFAVVDVNYGGSTGFGRAYRDLLRSNWGVVDHQDAAAGAQFLIKRGDVDKKRIAITGMSAGGYATICGVTFHKLFSAGSAQFGISDMEAMAGLFHKFQSRFLQTMIGKFPEQREIYRKRSAINYVEQIDCPLLILHGALDSIVPISQSELLAKRMTELGKPHQLITFDDEPHVFRKAENIRLTMETELAFFAHIFGIKAEDIDYKSIAPFLNMLQSASLVSSADDK